MRVRQLAAELLEGGPMTRNKGNQSVRDAFNSMAQEEIMFTKPLTEADPVIAASIAREGIRQAEQIELIASENIVSQAVIDAQGSVLTNKYAEGYPGRRYYGGCEYVDEVEAEAIDRLKKLFGCEYANVHSQTASSIGQWLRGG